MSTSHRPLPSFWVRWTTSWWPWPTRTESPVWPFSASWWPACQWMRWSYWCCQRRWLPAKTRVASPWLLWPWPASSLRSPFFPSSVWSCKSRSSWRWGSVQAEMREKEENGEKRIIDGNLLHKGKLKRQMQNKTCRWPLPDRLKLYRYIETFHIERQFTVQYELYGAVTFASQGKVGFWLVFLQKHLYNFYFWLFLITCFLHQVHHFSLQASVQQLNSNKFDFLLVKIWAKLHWEHSLLPSVVTNNFKNKLCFWNNLKSNFLHKNAY